MENIRKMRKEEGYDVLDLWMRSFTEGHPFIENNFWQKYYDTAKESYLDEKDTYVYAKDDKILGFVSVAVDGTIRGIYVDPDYHKQRIGTKLAYYVQDMYMALNMDVHMKNKKALKYATYLGFLIVGAYVGDEDEGEISYRLSWNK